MSNNLKQIYEAISNSSNKIFCKLENSQITYAELRARIELFSGYFTNKRLSSGARIVVCSDDEEFTISIMAAALFNGIALTVLTTATPKTRLSAIIAVLQPAALFIDEAKQAIAEIKVDFHLFSIAKLTKSSSGLLKKFRKSTTKNWLETLKEFPVQQAAIPEDTRLPAFINFTSGTTGNPKGVQITIHNLLAHLATLCKVFGYNTNSQILNNMILAHADGSLQGPILALYAGCTLNRPCGMDVQHLEHFLNTVYRDRVTHLITVPTVLSFIDRLAENDDYFDGGDFSHLISVAGMLDNNLWRRLEKRFRLRVNNIYGLTETVAGGIFCGPLDENFKHGTVGKPIDMSIQLVEGELWLKGENVFAGYYNNSEATDCAFSEGWFKTGDLAKIDNEGFVSITGRIKELIITGGFNVHSAEVNEALLLDERIAEAATVGFPDPEWQEIVVSAIVTNNHKPIDEQSIIENCRKYLEGQKLPRKIFFLENLPKGDAGKVNIPKLKSIIEAAMNEEKNVTSSKSNLSEDALLALAARIFKVNIGSLSLSSSVGTTTGWDSLGHLNLIMEIEKITGSSFSPQQIISVKSLRQILDVLKKKE